MRSFLEYHDTLSMFLAVCEQIYVRLDMSVRRWPVHICKHIINVINKNRRPLNLSTISTTTITIVIIYTFLSYYLLTNSVADCY